MAVAETARLIASLELKDLFTKSVDNATKSLGKLDKSIDGTQGRAYKAGQQIGTGIKRGLVIAVGAATGLTALFIKIAKEGQHAADVQAIFANAVARSGKITQANVAALNAQSLALSNLTGMDDEQIKSEQTRLVQMKLSAAQILKLTPLILDAAKSTGRDLDSVTLAVGRAAQGSATSLGRLGIIIPKTAKKSKDAFGDVVKALQAFQGTNAALAGSIDVKLSVFRERLQDIREEADIKLLPALTRIIDTVTAKLLPAFQQFIDAILPDVISGLNKFADALQSGEATKGLTTVLNTIKVAAPIIQKSAEATFTIVKAAVDLFTSLPAGLQQLAVGAFAINKLTGGLVTNVGGGIADFVAGKIGLLRGQTPATPLFVSDVTGGLGGAAGGVAGAAEGGLAGTLKSLIKFLPVIGLGLVAGDIQNQNADQNIIGPAIQKAFAAGRLSPDQIRDAVKEGFLDASALVQANAPRIGASTNPNSILDRGGKATIGSPGIANTINGTVDRLLAGVIAAVKNGFGLMLTELRNAKTAKQIVAAVKEADRQINGLHKGSVTGTKDTLAGLRALLKKTSDPKLRADIKTALAKVQAKIPGREYAQKQIAKADKLINDGKITIADTKAIKRIQADLVSRGLPHAASVIQTSVDGAKGSIVSAQQDTTAAIKAQQVAVTVENAVTFSLRSLLGSQAKYQSATRGKKP